MQTSVVRNLTVRGQSQGLEKVAGDLGKVSAAQERVSQTSDGMAKATETSSRRQLSAANGFERLTERLDRMVYLQRQQDREMQIVNRAFETGHIAADRHGQAVAMVQAKYDKLIATETAARQAMAATSTAVDGQTAAVMRLAAANDNLAAANDNARFASANVAAQFQDIGVTAAMGMSPIMIALQQGTQLSAVLNTMQNPVRGLGTALLSILNPVSLLTIGFVTLTASAIQFFMASNDNAEDASTALERHNEWLDKTLAGYDKAREAARQYVEEAQKLPEAAVASDLGAGRKTALDAYGEQLVVLRAQFDEFQSYVTERARGAAIFGNDSEAVAAVGAMQSVLDVVDRAGLSANSTAKDFDDLVTSLTLIKNSDADADVLHLANAMLELVQATQAERDKVGELDTALRALPRDISTIISVRMEAFGEARTDLLDLMPDFRDRYTKMRDEAKAAHDEMRANATDQILRLQADNDLAQVLSGIDRLQSQDEAKKASRGGKSELEKAANSYDDLTLRSRQFIAEQELSISTLGMSAEATARLRYEQDMLNEAANDNIALGPAQREEIASLAAQMASAEERARSLSESFNFGRDVFKGFFADLRQGLKEGDSLWDAFFNAASNAIDRLLDKAMDAALDQVWNGLWGSIMGAFGGGGLTGSTLGGGLSTIFNARGNVYSSSPSLSAYSSQIVDKPTMFAFAKGAGLMGEAGPEAIMPLGRDGAGRLGVRVANQNGATAANSNVRVEIHNYSGQPVKQEQAKGADGVDITRIIIGTVNEAIAGGRMDGIMSATFGVKRQATA